MSEYWKSTPKYWCKFCKTYVRDTTLERKQHEATPRHQSSIQRSLRELHKGTEREAREKQRAVDEVARLDRLVSNKSTTSASSSSAPTPWVKQTAQTSAGPAKATPDQRKRQIEQLAAMGVAVPDEYRKDMSIATEWSTVSERPVYNRASRRGLKAEDEEDDEEDSKLSAGAFGVRKRKLDEDDEEAEAAAAAYANRNWGSKFKTYPSSKVEDEDLDALLTASIVKKRDVKQEDQAAEAEVKREAKDVLTSLKTEESASDTTPLAAVPDVEQPGQTVEEGQDVPAAPVVFKKRKAVKR